MHLIILGPHGAGKGTQAKLVAEHYKIAHISTGDILREHIKNKTNVGMKAKEYIDASKYVPDKIVDVVVVLKIRGNKAGFVLDGYPRTLTQAKFLDNLLKEFGIELDAAINLQVDKEELIERMIERGRKEKRSDDTEEGIRSRMNEYETKAEPVIDYYRKEGKIVDIDGDKSVEQVFKNIKNVLDKMVEQTLIIIKPDGVRKNLEKEIVKKYEDAGLVMIRRKQINATSDFLKKHYSAHVEKPFYPKLEKFMSSGSVVAMIFEGKDAVAIARKVTGVTDPAKAEEGTVRRHFGDFSLPDDDRITMNLVHASATKEEAEKEIKLWFG